MWEGGIDMDVRKIDLDARTGMSVTDDFNCWWASALMGLNIQVYCQRTRPLYLFTIYFSLYGMIWTVTQFFIN
jgi:hypothetical protein